MNHLYRLLTFCLLLPLFQANATFSEELPNLKSTSRKPLDCGIPAPTIVNYGCLDIVWEKNYKRINNNYTQFSESPTKVYSTADGGYIFASSSQFNPSNGGDADYVVTKTDGNGNKLWTKVFGTPQKDFLYSFVPTTDGGYILGGYSDAGIEGIKTSPSQGSNDIWLVKIDANGNKIWDKSFGGSDQDLLGDMIATSDGGFLLAATSGSGINGDKTGVYFGGYDNWLIKIDANGVKQWDKTFGGDNYDWAITLGETTDGYILVSQSSSGISGNKTSSTKGNTDFWIVKMDFTGTKIWDNTYGGSGYDTPKSINKISDGSIIISGFSLSPISGDKSQKGRGLRDVWILKIDASGTKIWDKTIGGNKDENVNSVTNTSSGNLIFNVQSNSDISGDKKHAPVLPNTNDQWLFEMRPDGTMLWEKYLVGNGDFLSSRGDLIIQNNHLIILGITDRRQAAQYDFWNTTLRKVTYCSPQTVGSTTICQGKCATLVGENCNSGVVKWSNGEYGTSICASPNTTQNYKSVCLSADSLCVGDSSAVFTVNVTPSDVVSISPYGFVNITSCGTSQTITATGCVNGTLSWSNGQTGNPITFIPTNNQIVKAICTMPNGCVSESSYLSISVTNISAPTIFGRPSQPICAGQPITLFTNDCTGGTANWTGGLTGSSITINPTSTFTMRVACSYSSGCVSDSSNSYPNDTIKVLPRPAAPNIANYSCLKKVWDKRFGGADGPDYEPKLLKVNGGYLLAGTSRSSNSGDRTDVNRGGTQNNISADYWIIKVDDNGNKLWDKAYGGSGDEFLSNIILLSDGNYMMAGWSNSGIGGEKSEASRGGKDYWIVKIDAMGNKLWDKTYGGSGDESLYNNAVDIRETSDGFILGGSSISGVGGDKTLPAITNGYYHFWILKLNQQGVKVWEKTFGGTGGEMFTSLELLQNSQYLLFGQSQSPANNTIGNKTSANKGNSDYWLVKIDSNGNKIWDRSYGGTDYDYPKTMVFTNDGKITMVGQSASPKSFDKSRSKIGAFGEDIWAVQVDTSGTKLWDKTYGGSRYEYTGKMCITPKNQGGFIITASSDSEKGYDKSENPRKDYYENNTSDYWIFEINENGEKLWDKIFGGNNGDQPTNAIVENNAVIMVGISYSGLSGDKSQFNNGPGNFWLVKMNYCQPNFTNSITICKNDSTFLTAQNCPNASTVKWSNGETVQTISVKPSVTTTYKAICITTDGGCQSDSSTIFTVVVNNVPPPSITAANTNLCVGESTTLTATGCQGTYGWTGGAITSSITVNSTVTKTYKVACTFNGCTSDSTLTTITVNPTPTKPVITTQSQNICVGGSIIISASGCNNGVYQWTSGLTGSSITVNPTNTTSIYKVACKVSNCVSDSSIAVTITTVAKPAIPTITPPTNNNICGGTNVSLTASACTGGILSWTSSLTGTSITVSPVATKSYKVVCTINGCSSDSSTAVTITVTPKPAKPTISSTGNNVCQGQNVILTASVCLNGTYGWTGGLTASSITISALGTKSYKVACTVNGCTSDSSLVTTVQISTKPAQPVIVQPTSTSICQGSSVSLLANGCSGGSLGWTGGIISPSFTVVLPVGVKSYKVACTINGCTSDSSSAVTITVNPKPAQPTINQAGQTICAGQNLNLTITPIGANTYTWTGGLTGTSINVAPITTKSYKVAALANGCASDSSSSVTITVQATSPSPTTTNVTVCEGTILTTGNGLKSTVPNCSGGGSSSVTATYSGGTVGYDGGSSSGSNPTATISGMSSTITKVRVSITWLKKGGGNSTSCGTAHNGGSPYHNETSFRIQAPDGTILNLVNNSTYSGSTTSTVTTVFEDGFPFVSSGVPVSGTFTPASPLSGFNGKVPNGVWTLLPNDSGSGDPLCVSGFNVTVSTNGGVVASNISWWDAQVFGNQVGTGAEYLPTANNLASGTYTYYAQALCTDLCPSQRVATTLIVSAKPSTPVITPPDNSTICLGSSITLSATGCPNGTYLWTGGLTGSAITVSPTTTTNYTVNCTVNNCVSTNSVAVQINVITNSYLETLKSGSWTDPTIWSCNRVPTSTDDVFINAGHTITDTGNILRAKSLNYRGGILKIATTTSLRLVNP